MAQFSFPTIPEPENEPIHTYANGSEERKLLAEACAKMRATSYEIPCIINGKEIKTGDIKTQVIPSQHGKTLCKFHAVTPELLTKAVDTSLEAKKIWEELPFTDRMTIFLKAADLLTTKYRYELVAATMLGQGKTVHQAEIDCMAELIDFLRFNPKYAEGIYKGQPPKNSPYTWNRTEFRPLEGYVVAISPFNFVAIGGNLPTAPAMMGNVVLWKPASTAILSNYLVYRCLEEAGLPAGVIQFIPGAGSVIGNHLVNNSNFAGLHFTGSTAVFNTIMFNAAENLKNGKYKCYPRIVGETGGKDFHFIHNSTDMDAAVIHSIRGAYEYQGQKCSATSRAYVPASLWETWKNKMVAIISQMKVGQPDDFSTFMTAVIDQSSFNTIKGYLDFCKADTENCEIIVGGNCDDSTGYFVEPTLVLCKDPMHKTMQEEIFGPVFSVYVYPDEKFEETLHLCNNTSRYALTGSFFGKDRTAIDLANKILRHSSGNFYVNDKSTGAVVGQQPFGGARDSGTNDKAGSPLNLLRWVSTRAIKETTVPPTTWDYPHMH